MHAEVTFTFRDDLKDRDVLLGQRFGSPADLATCIGLTSLSGHKILESHVCFATHSNSAVRLFIPTDARVLKIHVESVRRFTLVTMRREIDDTISDMKRLAKSAGTKVKSIRAVVAVDDCELQQMRVRSFMDRLRVSMTENLLQKLYIPLATFAVTFFYGPAGTDFKKAATNALIAIAATVVWVIVDALVLQPSISYSEV